MLNIYLTIAIWIWSIIFTIYFITEDDNISVSGFIGIIIIAPLLALIGGTMLLSEWVSEWGSKRVIFRKRK